MIRCPKCHIDYDRCDCGMEDMNMDTTPFWVIMGTAALIALSLTGIIIYING